MGVDFHGCGFPWVLVSMGVGFLGCRLRHHSYDLKRQHELAIRDCQNRAFHLVSPEHLEER